MLHWRVFSWVCLGSVCAGGWWGFSKADGVLEYVKRERQDVHSRKALAHDIEAMTKDRGIYAVCLKDATTPIVGSIVLVCRSFMIVAEGGHESTGMRETIIPLDQIVMIRRRQ